ncbi:hypothetical protein Ga0100231_024110 [Opitutaceae bacterium TAV4]|nr:hypothetical protein Ga0100231_024110 [Opitutaceae bacterium TAV4]RRK00797.1 hypothetical protein Ga0100230_023685 [Opitutaceae bacterium TAV3]
MSYALQLTDAGLAKLATVLDGQRLVLSQIAVGSGTTDTPAGLAALVHEEYRTDIQSRTPVAGGIRVSVVLPENVGGFLVREIGLIDIDGLLIAYGVCPAFPKAGAGDGYASAVTLSLTLLLTTAQTVQVNVLPQATHIRNGVVPLAVGEDTVEVVFGPSFPEGAIPSVSFEIERPAGGDFLVRDIISSTASGFTAKFTGPVPASGYYLHYNAILT